MTHLKNVLTTAVVMAVALAFPAHAQLGLLDSTPPKVSIVKPADGAFVEGLVVIEASASDGLLGSGVSSVEYQIDSTQGAWTSLSRSAVNGNWTAQWNSSALADGGRILYLRARDRAGNSAIAQASLVVAQAPAIPSGLSVRPPAAPSNGGYLDLSWSANSEPDLAGYFIYRSNAYAGPYARIATVATTTWRDTVKNGATQYYRVAAFDAAGNESKPCAIGQGTAYDTRAPVLGNVSAVLRGSDRADVTWMSDEGASSQVFYGMDPSTTQASAVISQPRQSHTVSLTDLLATTTYFYRVRSVDGAGNATTSDVFTFTTPEDLPPVVTIIGPADGAVVTGSARLQAQASDDLGLAAVEYTFDGLTWSAMPFNSLTGYYEASLDGLPDGQRQVGVRASDEIGQTAIDSVVISLDRQRPSVAWVNPELDAHLPVGTSYTFQVNATDDTLSAVDWQIYLVPPGVEVEVAPEPDPAAWSPMTFNAQTGFHEVAYPAPITVTERVAFIYARATDAAGRIATSVREITFIANGVDFEFIGSAGQRLFGTVAIEPIGPNGGNVIGIQLRGRTLTGGGRYALTVTSGGNSHRVTLTADGRGRGVVEVEEATGINDEFSASLTPSGPGF